MKIDRYFKNEDLEEVLNIWSENYPGLIQLSTIGQSHAGLPIWLVTLTNQRKGNDTQKPAIWIDANIHATEIAGTTTALTTIYYLLYRYNKDQRITHLLDTCTFYIVPRVNPDGAALALSAQPKYIRSGIRPYPYEEKEDGLHPEDINNDGRILQMRIKDPNGDWKISSLDARLMEKRSPIDHGEEYYRLLPEGTIENFDGYQIKVARSHQGLDFNRNFPYDWRPENQQSGAGPYPASEPEIKAILDFVTTHLNINIAITFHTYSRVLLRPYSTKPDEEMDTSDLWVFKKIGEIGTDLTGYRCVSTYHDFMYHPKEVTTGAFDDWIYDHFGVFSYTIELWDLPTEAGIKDRKFIEWWRIHPHEEDKQILDWVDKNAPPNSYVDWFKFDHPQLGEVELGGWDRLFTWSNPPPNLIGQEADLHAPFMTALAEMLPHLSVLHSEISQIEADTFKINIVIENTGFLPTYTSQQGKNRKAVRPIRAELTLSDLVKLVSGEQKINLGHLEGRSNKLSVSASTNSSPTDNRTRFEWVVQAPAGTELLVTIKSDRAGTLEHPIKLI